MNSLVATVVDVDMGLCMVSGELVGCGGFGCVVCVVQLLLPRVLPT